MFRPAPKHPQVPGYSEAGMMRMRILNKHLLFEKVKTPLGFMKTLCFLASAATMFGFTEAFYNPNMMPGASMVEFSEH